VEAVVTPFEQALSDSQAAFRDLVWPVIAVECGGGRIVPVEAVTATDFARELDILSGIDAWQIFPGNGAGEAMRGIASRVQWNQDWPTFTVRRSVRSGGPTEYHKRCAALEGGYLSPYLTVQAYIAGGELLSVGVATTAAVIAAVDPRNWRPVRGSGETFYVVPFSDVPEMVFEWHRDEAA
jgi:hypothetical protein